MGYTTKFFGRFNLSRKLTLAERKEIEEFINDQYPNDSPVAPSMHCDWRITSDSMGIEWNSREKFYQYVPWLQVIIDDFLLEMNIRTQGEVAYWGDGQFEDCGTIVVENSVITVKKGYINTETVTKGPPTL